MSESDDLGGLHPTTPHFRKKQPLAAHTKSNSRNHPGPSSQPAYQPAEAKRKNLNEEPSADSDIEELTPTHHPVPSGSTAIKANATQVQRRARRPRVRTDASTADENGITKGKQKAIRSRAVKTPALQEAVDVDIEIIDDAEAEQAAGDLANAINSLGKRKRPNIGTEHSETTDDNSRMAEQLRRAEAQIETLSRQLEEALQIRQTEAEELLERQELQYHAQLQAQETLIKELTSHLAQKEPLTRTGTSSVLHLLTREAADEEKRTLEKEMALWKEKAEENKRVADAKDKIISQLERTEKELQFDLKAEIDRANSLAVAKSSRNIPNASRGRQGGLLGADDPKHAEVIRFYEDLTNLLVTNMKLQTGKYFNLEEWIFTCIYTYMDGQDESANNPKKSLSFTLCFCFDASDEEPIISKDQLINSVHYVPLELDKETHDFVEGLGFLGKPFTFGREQLQLFLRTIYERMGVATDEGSDESVQGGDDE